MATLIALAVLAERASVRSLPVRWLVLLFLRHAEAVAREFVVETTQTQRFARVLPIEGNPADAMLLAARFRALAAAIAALLHLACRLGLGTGRVDASVRLIALQPGQLLGAPGGWALGSIDTS